jgi:hypothetical protein
MYNLLTIFLVSLGIFLIIRGTYRCPGPQKIIEYRYIPRTLKEENEEPVKTSEIFSQMFQQETLLPNRL